MTSGHQAYDAWILLAILIKAQPGEFPSLDEIIGAADYINHAIPTSGELDGALFRLIESGWIEQEDLCFAPTERAESMYAPFRGRRTAITTDLEHVRSEIGAGEWSSELPEAPGQFRVAGLSAEAITAAVKTYKSRMGG